MSFRVILYLDQVTARLEILPAPKRVAFAVWCIQPLLDEFTDFVEDITDSDDRLPFREAIDEIWDWAATGTTPQIFIIEEARKLAKSIDWSEDDVDPDDGLSNRGGIELIGGLQCMFDAFKTGSARSAAETAEGMINRIVYELEMIEGVNDALFDSRFMDEINRQQRMLQYIETEPLLLEEDRTRFRN